jgi:hypothetical protein
MNNRPIQFQTLPVFGGDPRQVAEVVRGIMDGRTNNTGKITLATGNATTTTLYDDRIGYNSLIFFVPVSDAAEADAAPYGEFTRNTSQTAPVAMTPATIEYDTTEESSGIYLSNNSRLNVRNAGVYNVQFSIQLASNDNALQYADVWFRKNGVDIPRSGTRIDIPIRKAAGDPSHAVSTVNIFVNLAAGDYVEVAGLVSATTVTLVSYAATTSPVRPVIPAAIVTMQYIAPMATSNLYVSSQQQGQATISHWANDTADKTYGYIIVG